MLVEARGAVVRRGGMPGIVVKDFDREEDVDAEYRGGAGDGDGGSGGYDPFRG